jgi:hypothetical protein
MESFLRSFGVPAVAHGRLRRLLIDQGTGRGEGAGLARPRTLRQLPILARLDDGSFLTRIGTAPVRIIEAEVTVHLHDGTVTAHR